MPDPKKGEVSYRWPEILPGGKAVLFAVWSGHGTFDDARIALLSLETGEQRVLVQGGSNPRYVSSGHMIYARAGGLLAAPFDLKELKVTGPPVSVVEGVSMQPVFGGAQFSVSGEGSLAFVPGATGFGDRAFLWVDREGATQALPAPPHAYLAPRISPDGQRLAVGIQGADGGMWHCRGEAQAPAQGRSPA